MASEVCPRCRRIQSSKVTVSSRKVKTAEGKTKQITTRSYHCDVCGSFIRSEEMEEPAEGG